MRSSRWRSLVWLLALMLVAAACGSGVDEDTDTPAADRTTPEVTPTPEATPDPEVDEGAEPQEDTTQPDEAPPEDDAPGPEGEPDPEPTGLRAPQAGSYDFHTDGTFRAGTLGQPQSYEEDGTLEIAHHEGAEMTFRFQTEQGETETRFRNEGERLLLLSIEFSDPVMPFQGDFDPPQMVLRYPIQVGDAWENEWTLNGTSGTSRFEIIGEEEIEAAGGSRHAFVIESTSEFSGDVDGTQHLFSWYVPELGLEVHQESTVEGDYQGTEFESESTRTITSLP